MTAGHRQGDVVQATISESAAIRRLNDAREKIVGQLSQVIVGQADVIEELLICPSPAVTACSKACRAWRRR